MYIEIKRLILFFSDLLGKSMHIGWYVKDGFRQSAAAKRTRYNCNTITVKRFL
jgi:hypothetical protein